LEWKFLLRCSGALEQRGRYTLAPIACRFALSPTVTSRHVISRFLGTTIAADIAYFVIGIRVHTHGAAGPVDLPAVGLVFSISPMAAPPLEHEDQTLYVFSVTSVVNLGDHRMVRAPCFLYWCAVSSQEQSDTNNGSALTGSTLLPCCGFVFIYQGTAERYLYLGGLLDGTVLNGLLRSGFSPPLSRWLLPHQLPF
jgi:hypothetical protein